MRARSRLANGTAAERGQVRWTWEADAAALSSLARALGLGNRVTSFQVVRSDAHARWLELELQGNAKRARVPVDEVRRLVGPKLWKSARIISTFPAVGSTISAGLKLEGLGRGHGVGLCQVGARELRAPRVGGRAHPRALLPRRARRALSALRRERDGAP